MNKTTSVFLWLLPIVTCLHVFEEFGFPGGLKVWIKSYKPLKLKSNLYYFVANATIILGAWIIAIKAKDVFGYRIYLFIIGVLGWNALTHIRGTLQKKKYCPGVISSSLLTFPLMVASNIYLSKFLGVDIVSLILFQITGCIIGYFIGGMDIRERDEIMV